MRIIPTNIPQKPINERIENLILRKLNIKVRDELIFIDKDSFLSLILKDIVLLAMADSDIEKALKLAIQYNPEYQNALSVRRNELAEALEEFKIEIIAYSEFLDNLDENMNDEDIYDNILFILNSEDELLHHKIIEIIRPKVEHFFLPLLEKYGQDQFEVLVTNSLYYIQTIALNETLEEAAEETFYSAVDELSSRGITLESTLKIIKDCNEKYKPEIIAYKLALSSHDQNAEIPASFALFKQMLGINE